jgi:hypothetical protein
VVIFDCRGRAGKTFRALGVKKELSHAVVIKQILKGVIKIDC